MPGKRRKVRGQIGLYYFIIFFIYALDQLSKFFVVKLILYAPDIPIIKNVFHIRLVYNAGAAFGLLEKYPYLIIISAVGAVILISYFLTRGSHILSVAEKVALCFLMGGTLGNLTDRIRFGYVIDFIDFRIWPVFNFADSFITIGAIMLGVSILAGIRAQKRK